MDNNGIKKRKRFRRRKNPPPPVFNRDSNNLPYSRYHEAPSTNPINTDEMLNRFNQLFDWRMPTHQNDYRQVDEGRFSPPRDHEFYQERVNGMGKRKVTDANDLRNRLDRQQYIRWQKDLERRQAYYSQSFDDYYQDRRFDRSDRVEQDRWQGSSDNQRIVREGEWDRERNYPPWTDSRPDYDMRDDRPNYDMRDGRPNYDMRDGRPDYDVRDGRPDYDMRDGRPDYNMRDGRPDEYHQFERQLNEHWSDRNPPDSSWKEFSLTQGGRIDSDHQSDYFRRDNLDESDTRKNWDGEYPGYSNLNSNRMDTPSNTPAGAGNYSHSTPSSSQQPSRYGPGTDLAGPSSGYPGREQTNNDDDLVVVIFKADFAKISFAEADAIRKMLIDLVVNSNTTNEMPEFINSGLMKGGRGFFVNCRTRESMEWLVKQNLRPINGVQLYVEKKKMPFETVEVSAFAQNCNRSREEILKLIQLQNSKKGFNFDHWIMRSYQSSPTGVYMKFDIGLNEAQLLKDFGYQLSFELKSLPFKLSQNANTNFAPNKY